LNNNQITNISPQLFEGLSSLETLFSTLLIPDNSNISNIKSTNPSIYNLCNVFGIPEGIAINFVIGSFIFIVPGGRFFNRDLVFQ
jgi:Leucine-rich repeat (LRR) protein